MRSSSVEFLRFGFAGALGTAITYGIYVLLALAVAYVWAFTLSYVIGIFLSYTLNTWLVFREPWSWSRLVRFPIVYVVQYLFGLACLVVLVEWLGVPVLYAPLFVVMLSLPLTFVLSRRVIRGART